MASINEDKKGWRVVFYDSHRTRKQIRIGKITKRQAQEIMLKIEKIVSAKEINGQLDPSTARWIQNAPDRLYAKLVNAGLAEPRQSTQLGKFVSEQINGWDDAKDSTKRKWESARSHLVDHFGTNKSLRSITAGDADDFRTALLRKKLAENTVRKYCGIAKQFFRAAHRKKLIDTNPFADIVTSVTGNPAKFHFVSESDSQAILTHCPDTQWRMIFALCRYGGLRCPSEVLLLRWADIDWEQKLIRVRSPKTEHHAGRDKRTVPLFPELAAELAKGLS
jgi:integrase